MATSALHGPNHAKSLKANPHLTPAGYLSNPDKYHPERSTIFERVEKVGKTANSSNYGLVAFDTSDTDKFSRELDRIDHYNTGAIYLDDQVKAILQKMKETGKDQNTLIIITADHGIEPGKSTCYEIGNQVPMIANWTGQISAGQVTDQLIQFIDFMPTFSNLAQAKPEQLPRTDGVDLTSLFKGTGKYQRKSIYFEMGYSRAVTDGKYKYIATRYPSFVSDWITSGKQNFVNHLNQLGQVHASVALQYMPGYFDADQLYDLSVDPYEQNNLANIPDYQSHLTRLKSELQSYLDQFQYPYDLSVTTLFKHPMYRKVVAESKLKGTEFVPWWPSTFVWPPVNLLK